MSRMSIVAGLALLMAGVSGAPYVLGQSQESQKPIPAFEVASIKPNKTMGQNMSLNTPNGGIEATNASLRILINFAYDIRDYQLSGGPDWLNTEHYDIVAKASTEAPVGGDNQGRVRMQALLADRFHLAVHHETKEMPVFALVQAKGGPKLQLWKEGDLPGPHMRLDDDKLTCRKQSMQRFATVVLSSILGRPVIDKTGLAGDYNFVMTFAAGTASPTFADSAPQNSTGPAFMDALQDQLGLKLERQRGPVDVLVIDSVQKPDPN